MSVNYTSKKTISLIKVNGIDIVKFKKNAP